MKNIISILGAVFIMGCAAAPDNSSELDASQDHDSTVADGSTDSGIDSSLPDSGQDSGKDSGTDSGIDSGIDSGTPDSGTDTGTPDSSLPDTGGDSSVPDSGQHDSGTVDSGMDADIDVDVDSDGDVDSGADADADGDADPVCEGQMYPLNGMNWIDNWSTSNCPVAGRCNACDPDAIYGWRSYGNHDYPPGGCAEGNRCLAVYGNTATEPYGKCENSSTTSPIINLAACKGLGKTVRLRFQHWYKFGGFGNTGVTIEFINDGNTWTKTAPIGGWATNNLNLLPAGCQAACYSSFQTDQDGQPGFDATGNQEMWEEVQFVLPNNLMTAKFQIRFWFVGDIQPPYTGVGYFLAYPRVEVID